MRGRTRMIKEGYVIDINTDDGVFDSLALFQAARHCEGFYHYGVFHERAGCSIFGMQHDK